MSGKLEDKPQTRRKYFPKNIANEGLSLSKMKEELLKLNTKKTDNSIKNMLRIWT